MSLTSYRAAPPRDKSLRALSKTGCRNGIGQRAGRAVPIRRLPEKATLGKAFGVAGGMYQRGPALERPMRALLRILSRVKTPPNRALRRQNGTHLEALARDGAKAQLPGQGAPRETSWTSH